MSVAGGAVTFRQHLMDPALVICGRQFTEPVSIVCYGSTYGRVLFRSHDVVINDCTFDACIPIDGALLWFVGECHGVRVSYCHFRPRFEEYADVVDSGGPGDPGLEWDR